MLILDIQKMDGNIGHFVEIVGTTSKKTNGKTYLKNAYRVLLTRARQGMVIVVPDGDKEDSDTHIRIL